MRVFSSIKEDIWHDLREAGSYEWWYFDAQSHDHRYSFVAIWYSGFPFSPYYLKRYSDWQRSQGEASQPLPDPLEHAAFSFNFYDGGAEVINFIKEGGSHLFSSSALEPQARFEQNEFYFDAAEQVFILKFDFSMPSRRMKIKGEVRFAVQAVAGIEHVAGLSAGEGTHSWVLAAPSAAATGGFDIYDGTKRTTDTIKFDGRGYHDHNFGTVPMNTDIQNWYWGRAHTEHANGHTDLVYYHIAYKDESRKPFTFLLLTETDQVIAAENKLQAELSGFARTALSLRYAKRLCLSNDRVQFSLDHHRMLDTGPFYLRFQSAFTVQLAGGTALRLNGISEFLHPDRTSLGVVQNLIKSKIWREGKTSAMYTLYNFFNRIFQ